MADNLCEFAFNNFIYPGLFKSIFISLSLETCVSAYFFFLAILFVVLSYCGSQKWKEKRKTVRALTGVL